MYLSSSTSEKIMMKTIAKNYKVLFLLGTGGMSEVYLAQDTKTGKKVAMKILDKKLSKDPEYIKRFKREVEISKTLDHSNIVKIISYGVDEGDYYIVYEYIEGKTLDSYIKSRKLSIEEIKKITLKILQGLSYAHSKNIIHRDIKPSNIMISKDGAVKILDFGIARATTRSTITKTGMFMGSPHYTSPEQIDGDRKDIDERTDIYSLGIVLYEMIEGKVPFQADTPLGFMKAHLDKPVPRIKRDIPSYMVNIVYRCLAKNPRDRFSTAEEMADALASRIDVGDTRMIPIKRKSKAKVFSIIGSVAVVIIVIIIVIIVVKNIGKEEAVVAEVIEESEEEPAEVETEEEVVKEVEETEESTEEDPPDNSEVAGDSSSGSVKLTDQQIEEDEKLNEFKNDLSDYLKYKDDRLSQWEIFAEIEDDIIDRMNKSNDSDLSIYKKLIINNTIDFLDHLYSMDMTLIGAKEHNAYIVYYEMHKRYWEYHLAEYEQSYLNKASIDFYQANIYYQNIKLEIIAEFNNRAIDIGERPPFSDSDIEKINDSIKAANKKITEVNTNI